MPYKQHWQNQKQHGGAVGHTAKIQKGPRSKLVQVPVKEKIDNFLSRVFLEYNANWNGFSHEI